MHYRDSHQSAIAGQIAMADGVLLHAEDWLLPAGMPRRGSALIVHGLGEHIGRYGHVARSLLSIGIEVRGYDQRGFGRSPGPRGSIPHQHALLDDARLVYDDWRDDRSDVPFLIGHSMGGAVAARAATGGWIRPRGLVLCSPAIAGRMSGLQKLALQVGKRLSPNRPVPSGLKAEFVSRDPAVVADYRSDPLNHGLITPRLAQFIVDAGPKTLAAAAQLCVPTLVLLGSADRLIDVASARLFYERLPPQLATLRVYEGFYHELFNEPAADRARLLADLNAWLVRVADGDGATR
jgi:alpha-beta hydrolase superfamily lysophospholipase